MGNELSTEEWKQKKKEQRAIFTARQRLPYEVKLKRQAIKAWQFYEEILSRDMNVHVSVGGLDEQPVSKTEIYRRQLQKAS